MAQKFNRTGIWGSNPSTERGRQAYLEGDPKGKNFLYCNGNNVFIRDIENPKIVQVYNEHTCATRSAKYSPSGFYIASGDEQGNLRIWDPNNREAKDKEYRPMSGAIKDIAWTEDSKRLVMVGEGNVQCGAAIMWDTGASVGKIDVSTRANSCDVRQKRPYRAITGADDFVINFYEGVPFKYKTKIMKHTNFVQKTKYSPNGDVFVSAGSDGQLLLHNGDNAEFIKALGGAKAHNGSIYGLSWSGDGKQILTASPDKTVKIWDVETGTAVTTFVIGKDMMDQQMACLWQNNYLISLSLNGDLNYLDSNDPSKPCRILQGHQKSVKTLAVNDDKTKVFSGSYDGYTACWDVSTSLGKAVGGKNKPKLLSQIDYKEGKLSTVGVDDTMRLVDDESLEFRDASCSLDSQPQAVARGAGELTVIGGIEKLTIVRGTDKASVLEVTYNATSVDIHPNQSEIAVADETGMIHIYTLASDNLTEKKSFQAYSETITRCRYSPDGEHLAAASASKEVEVYKVMSDYEEMNRKRYRHYSKVTDVAWSSSNRHYASTSLDGSVYVWVLDKDAPLSLKHVHGRSETNCVAWLNEKTLVTGGADACLRTTEVELDE